MAAKALMVCFLLAVCVAESLQMSLDHTESRAARVRRADEKDGDSTEAPATTGTPSAGGSKLPGQELIDFFQGLGDKGPFIQYAKPFFEMFPGFNKPKE